MMKSSFVATALVLFLLGIASAGLSALVNTAAEQAAREAINSGNRRYIATLEARDAKGFAALYTVDGIQMDSSGQPVVRGRATIQSQSARDFVTTRYTAGTIATTNLAIIGDMAYETGKYSFTYQVKGKQAVTSTGRYLVVWQRQIDGSYLIKVDAGFPQACPRGH